MRRTTEQDGLPRELQRILDSESFRGTERLRRFLEYVVTESYAGRGHLIKEYTIGLHVFDKPEAFDPKIDSTVRSEASKLRARLRLYYETEGRENPLIISIPKGGYLAAWSARTSPIEAPPKPNGRRILTVAILAILIASAAAASWRLRGNHLKQSVLEQTPVRRLTNDELSFHPALSSDGSLIVYASDRAGNGDLDLWLQTVSGKEAIRLTTDPADDSDPTFSPDGSLIAFRSERAGGGIYVIPTLGAKAPRLLAARGTRPRFSPDGSHIAYSITNPNYYFQSPQSGSAFVIPANGGNPRPIAPHFDSSHFPIYSADGHDIYYLGAEHGTRKSDWWRVPANGDGPPQPTGILPLFTEMKLRGSDYLRPILLEAFFDGHVWFAARWGDEINIWRLKLSGHRPAGQPERVTRGATTASHPTVSRSGLIAFSSAVPNAEIAAVPLVAESGTSTGPVEWIASSPADEIWPSASADGKGVTFFSQTRDGRTPANRGGIVYRYDAATRQAAELLPLPGIRPWNELSRDGRSIVFHQDSGSGYDAWEQPVDGSAPPQLLCKDCLFGGWTSNRRTLIFSTAKPPQRIMRRDGNDASPSVYVSDATHSTVQPMLSPDNRWLAFSTRLEPGRSRIQLAPWNERPAALPADWIPVTNGAHHDTTPVWSPEGRLLYFASNVDGFTCIYAQRIRSTSPPLDATPFAVRHFHSAGLRPSNPGVAFRGIAVASGKLVLGMYRRSGNVWLLGRN